jgi:hypothetical protein
VSKFENLVYLIKWAAVIVLSLYICFYIKSIVFALFFLDISYEGSSILYWQYLSMALIYGIAGVVIWHFAERKLILTSVFFLLELLVRILWTQKLVGDFSFNAVLWTIFPLSLSIVVGGVIGVFIYCRITKST